MAFPRMRGNGGDGERLVHPNSIFYNKMEHLIKKMLDTEDGVPIRTVKSFLSKIPSVFTGQDLIAWIIKHCDMSDPADALHLAHLTSSHGYLFQIDDHVLTVKNDGTFYRFQTPYFWPSNCWEPENTDYAVYLCKRTMQNKAHLELEDFEAENLAKLQKLFSRKWEFVFMQAEAQYKVDKKRDRMERQILDSQERAFWDVHRPVPGCVNTTEVDFRKLSRSGRPKYSASNTLQTVVTSGTPTFSPYSTSAITAHAEMTKDGDSSKCSTSINHSPPPECNPAACGIGSSGTSTSAANGAVRTYSQRPGMRRCTQVQDTLSNEISVLQNRLAKNVLKTSKVVENYLQYYEHRKVFDACLIPLSSPADSFASQPNPWISDTVDFWQHDKITGDISTRRLKLWEECYEELLSDPLGRETLQKFLDKEYSGENLRFWWEVQKLRKCSCRMVSVLVTEIYNEFIDTNATSPVNIDCKVMDMTEENLKNPNRWSFDEAADHIYCLMKNDSYQRFLRSDIYRDLLTQSKKKAPVKVAREMIRFPNITGFAQNVIKRDNVNNSHITPSTHAINQGATFAQGSSNNICNSTTSNSNASAMCQSIGNINMSSSPNLGTPYGGGAYCGNVIHPNNSNNALSPQSGTATTNPSKPYSSTNNYSSTNEVRESEKPPRKENHSVVSFS